MTIRVEEYMTADLVTVRPGQHLDEVRTRMEQRRFRRVPVVEDGKLLGLLADRDIRERWTRLPETRVDAAMTRDVTTVTPKTPLESAASTMLEHQYGGLPVVENDEVVGIITRSDVLRAFCELTTDTHRDNG